MPPPPATLSTRSRTSAHQYAEGLISSCLTLHKGSLFVAVRRRALRHTRRRNRRGCQVHSQLSQVLAKSKRQRRASMAATSRSGPHRRYTDMSVIVGRYMLNAILGLEKYKPSESKSTRTLGRFPMRNKFVADYIFEKTQVKRTPKQVGSRIQQLRDTQTGKESKCQDVLVGCLANVK